MSTPWERVIDRMKNQPPPEPKPEIDDGGLYGLNAEALATLGVRNDQADLYDARGNLIGNTAHPEIVGLMADGAGRAVLQGRLPKDPIDLPPGCPTIFKNVKILHYPYSIVRCVLITKGLEMFCRGASWVHRPITVATYGGGIPVLGYLTDPSPLAEVRWPRCFLLTKNKILLEEIRAVVGPEMRVELIKNA
jgi:hypothetical protein